MTSMTPHLKEQLAPLHPHEARVTLEERFGAQGSFVAQTQSLGQILMQMGVLEEGDLKRARRYQKKHRCTLGEALSRMKLAARDDIHAALAVQYGFLKPGYTARSLPSELSVLLQPKSQAAEQIRLLRTRLLTTQTDDVLSLLSVAPAGYSARADFLTANLAVSFAQLNKKVLIVDADFIEPRMGRFFGISRNQYGLANILNGTNSFPDVVVDTPVTNLSLLTAGEKRQNLHELIASPVLIETLNEARKTFDMVLVVSAPAIHESAARYVWMASNATLIAARRHITRFAELDRLSAALRQVDASVLGAALTR